MIRTIIIFLLVVYILIGIFVYVVSMFLLDRLLQHNDESIKDDELFDEEDERHLYETTKIVVANKGIQKTILLEAIITMPLAMVWPLIIIWNERNKHN